MIYINNILLEAAADATQKLESAEALAMGLKVLLLGISTVFAVLALLWIVLMLFKVIFYREKKPDKKKSEDKPAPAIELPAVPETEPDTAMQDDSLIAVITAAISAYTAEEEGFSGGFRVVSFRRAEPASPWNKKYK